MRNSSCRARLCQKTASRSSSFTAPALLLVLSVQLGRRPARPMQVSAVLMAAGVVLFSGGIYARVALDLGRTFNVAPVGGLLLMAGWCVCLYALLRSNEP